MGVMLFACAHGAAKAPQGAGAVEVEERRSYEAERYVSARAYRHYLDALLARGADDYATAASELREALLYDPDSPHLHTVLAEVLLKQGRVGEAEEELKAALSLDPAHPPALLMLARIAEARERPAEARKLLVSAIEAAPSEPEAYREMVRLELSLGDPAAAAEAAGRLSAASSAAQARAHREQQEQVEDDESRGSGLVAAERLREQAAGAWVDVARAYVQGKDAAGAERAFAEALAAQPSDPEALMAQASFLESEHRIPEARELLLRLLARRPEAPEVLASLARLALEEGDLDTVNAHARKLLGLAAGIGPGDGAGREDERRELAAALLRVAVPLLGARRSADAQAALEGALRLYPDHPELAFYRAMALVQRGRAREGAQVFEQVEKKLRARKGEPPSPELLGVAPEALALDARVQAALARSRAGETQESVRRMRAIFAAHPEDEGVPLALLEACDRAGKTAEAEALLAAASREHPGSDELLFALANARDRLGQRQKALATMRKVLAVQPAHAGALNYIGYTLSEEGGPAALREAEALLARAVELRPDDGAIADSWGFCLLKLGRTAEALRELQRADRLSPGDPVILSHLGDALSAAGRREEALAAFRHALSRLAPAAGRRVQRNPAPQALLGADQARAQIDPPDRQPEPDDAKVRAELEGKLKALQER